MKKYLRITSYIAGLALITSLVLPPTFALARENSSGGNDSNKKEKSESGRSSSSSNSLNSSSSSLNGRSDDRGRSDEFEDESDDDRSNRPSVVNPTNPAFKSIKTKSRPNGVEVQWKTYEKTDGTLLYSLNSPVSLNSSSTVSIADPKTNRKEHKIKINPLQANTQYFAILVSRDASNNISTSSEFSFHTKGTTGSTTADTVAPVISDIVSVVNTTSIRVGWKTNESATSKVYYGTTSILDISASTTQSIERTPRDRNHLITVPNLSTSTTYYFVVESKDPSGNISRSSIFSATTSATPPVVDSSAPTISNAVAVISSTTAKLSWNTNESATTKVYYSTSTPVNISSTSTPFIESTTLVNAHSVTVTGLATSTTYYMILESKDAIGNATRTTEFSFSTASGI